MKRGLAVFGGILIVLIGLGFVFPAIAQLRDSGNLPGLGVALLFLGGALTLGGVGAAYYGIRRLQA